MWLFYPFTPTRKSKDGDHTHFITCSQLTALTNAVPWGISVGARVPG